MADEHLLTDEHCTTSGAARIAENTAETIRAWKRQGRLKPVMQPGGINIYRRSDVERVARERDKRRKRRVSDGDEAA